LVCPPDFTIRLPARPSTRPAAPEPPQRRDRRAQLAAPLGERVLHARWDLGVGRPCDQTGGLEFPEPDCDELRIHVAERALDLGKSSRPAEQALNDVKRPLIPDEL